MNVSSFRCHSVLKNSIRLAAQNSENNMDKNQINVKCAHKQACLFVKLTTIF